jgi:preprotein translocase subunit SecF
VFDKVRENTAGLLASSRSTYSQAANQALNQTLVRSINTSIIALLPVAAILVVSTTLLAPGELRDLSLVLFVGMLSGTYSSICIATPVLADLKEREPQYKALAKRVQLRASGGRAAQRAAAKAAAGTKPAASRGGRRAAGGPEQADLAAAGPQDAEPDVTDQTADEDADTGAVAPGEPVAAGAGQPSARNGPRPGPRQQPRRSSAAKRRPSGKKRRR